MSDAAPVTTEALKTVTPPAAAPAAGDAKPAPIAGDVLGALSGADAGTDAKPAGEGAKPGEEQKAPTPVELKLPEGAQYDAAELAELQKFATDSGLSVESAQKLLEFDVARETARSKAAQVKLDAQSEEWAKQVMADKELGGEKWTETKGHIARARAHFGAPVAEAQKLLAHVGLGTHPLVVRMFAALGKAAGEDTVKGTLTPATTAPSKSDAEIF